jgi:hypothetical protein
MRSEVLMEITPFPGLSDRVFRSESKQEGPGTLSAERIALGPINWGRRPPAPRVLKQ